MIYRNKLRMIYKAYALIYSRRSDIINSPKIRNLTREWGSLKLKNKVVVTILIEIFVLLILPLIFVNLSKPHEAMGIFMIFFFVINPVASATTNMFVGKDIKKLWWFPILFALVFLLSYWIVLKEIVLDLTIYAIMYILIGYFVMAIFRIIKRK